VFAGFSTDDPLVPASLKRGASLFFFFSVGVLVTPKFWFRVFVSILRPGFPLFFFWFVAFLVPACKASPTSFFPLPVPWLGSPVLVVPRPIPSSPVTVVRVVWYEPGFPGNKWGLCFAHLERVLQFVGPFVLALPPRGGFIFLIFFSRAGLSPHVVPAGPARDLCFSLAGLGLFLFVFFFFFIVKNSPVHSVFFRFFFSTISTFSPPTKDRPVLFLLSGGSGPGRIRDMFGAGAPLVRPGPSCPYRFFRLVPAKQEFFPQTILPCVLVWQVP